MKLGFTGTREQPTDTQLHWLATVFETLNIDVLHHGACVGADYAAHIFALKYEIPIVVHPPTNNKFLAVQCMNHEHRNITVLPASPYLVRNRAIVGAVEGLVAVPKGPEPTGLDVSGIGGTWYTVQFAMRLNKPVVICYPDGEIEKRETHFLRNPGMTR